jgi:hypothetical protein
MREESMRFQLFGLMVLLLLAGCGGGRMVNPGGPGTDGQPMDSSKPIRLTITSPSMGEVIEGNSVAVQFELDNYLLRKGANGMGNHVHVILDNEPYHAHYDINKPVVFEDLSPGTHTIRAFASRPWHESWKQPTAFAHVTFHIGHENGRNAPDFTKPLVTYSRPKGTYSGDKASGIIVDFWLHNAELGATHDVRVIVNDKVLGYFSSWEPHVIPDDALVDGENSISLTLVDRNGAPVASNAFNHTQRTFTVKRGQN